MQAYLVALRFDYTVFSRKRLRIPPHDYTPEFMPRRNRNRNSRPRRRRMIRRSNFIPVGMGRTQPSSITIHGSFTSFLNIGTTVGTYFNLNYLSSNAPSGATRLVAFSQLYSMFRFKSITVEFMQPGANTGYVVSFCYVPGNTTYGPTSQARMAETQLYAHNISTCTLPSRLNITSRLLRDSEIKWFGCNYASTKSQGTIYLCSNNSATAVTVLVSYVVQFSSESAYGYSETKEQSYVFVEQK